MDELIKNKKRDGRGLKILIILKNVKSGMKVSEASQIVSVSETTYQKAHHITKKDLVLILL